MGYNISVCCHKCEERVDILRGFESEAIRGFYIDHLNCYQDINSNLNVGIDNNKSEPAWMKPGFYSSEVYPPDMGSYILPQDIKWEDRLIYNLKQRNFTLRNPVGGDANAERI